MSDQQKRLLVEQLICYKLILRQEADVLQAAADYAAHPAVLYAEPNYMASIQGNP